MVPARLPSQAAGPDHLGRTLSIVWVASAFALVAGHVTMVVVLGFIDLPVASGATRSSNLEGHPPPRCGPGGPAQCRHQPPRRPRIAPAPSEGTSHVPQSTTAQNDTAALIARVGPRARSALRRCRRRVGRAGYDAAVAPSPR